MLYTESPQDTSGYAAIITFQRVWVATNHFWESFSDHSELLNGIACRSFILDVAQIGQETRTEGQTLNNTLSTVRLSLTDSSCTASRLLRPHGRKQMKIRPTV